jgi:hypothetical protein
MDSKKITCTQKKKIKTKQNYYDMFIPSVDKNMQQKKNLLFILNDLKYSDNLIQG